MRLDKRRRSKRGPLGTDRYAVSVPIPLQSPSPRGGSSPALTRAAHPPAGGQDAGDPHPPAAR